MFKLGIVLTSTREQRACPAIAKWFTDIATTQNKFEIESLDLKTINLPPMDEPHHPMLRKYTQDHTKRWSALVAACDAFVWVMPEYNYAMPPAMLNAIDYVYHEWNYKACGFVSYGGVSGGTRSVQSAKPVLTSIKMMPIPEAVALPFFNKQRGEDGTFDGGEPNVLAANKMLDELHRWTTALKAMRT